jgi:hypothetical protein
MKFPVSCFVAVAMFAIGALPASAQWSGASVFTDDGVEIGIEPRVFCMFALLNEAGYNTESLSGPAPLELPKFSPIREKMRANASRSSNKALVDLILKNPGTVQQYIDAALELGPAPRFDDSAAKSSIAKALAPAIREWYNEEGGSSMLRNANADVKETQKRLLPVLNKAIKQTAAVIRLGDVSDQLLDDAGAQGRVALALNELDAHSTLSIHLAGDTLGVFAGPFANKGDEDKAVDAVVYAYAETLTVGEVNKIEPAGTILDGHAAASTAVKERFPSPKAWGRALLSCAVARHVLGRPSSCVGLDDDAASQGALALIVPRVKEYAATTALFGAALPDLLAAPPPAPAEEAPAEAPKAPAAPATPKK